MAYPIPRLPIFNWRTLSGPQQSKVPCLLTNPNNHYTNSGRASILLALRMLGVGSGHKVLVPTYHCPTMIAPIVAQGAVPVFYPLDSTGLPQLEWVKNQGLEGVRAILVAHFFGLPQPLANLREWCRQHDVRLIEDCAHALFGTSDGRAIGSWGDLAIASLTKFLPVPEGGCLVNNMGPTPLPPLQPPPMIRQVRAIFDIVHAGTNHGRLKGLGAVVGALYGGWDKLKNRSKPQSAVQTMDPPPSDGFTIDTEQAHLSLTRASRWITQFSPRERIVSGRRANYQFFAEALAGLAGMRPLNPHLSKDCAPYVFPLWVDHPDPGYLELRSLGFPVSRWDRLWPSVPKIMGDSGIEWSTHVLQLACHQDLTTSELNHMVSTLKLIFDQGSQ
jgi:perosamine synthetase